MEEKEPYVLRSLERVAIRMREGAHEQAAWRMIVESDRGAGAITLVDSVAKNLYRGEGIFLGLSQEELGATYERLNKPPDEPAFEVPQLG